MKLILSVVRLFAYILISKILVKHGIPISSIWYWAVMLLTGFTSTLSFIEGLK
jgi:hypothetical protein